MHLIIFITDALGSCAMNIIKCVYGPLLVLYKTVTLKVNGRVSRLIGEFYPA